VHCETSTGVLNNLATLKSICSEKKIKLCLDCISSIGTVPVDLSGVYLASCVSGKALASFPGLSMVFYNHDLGSAPKKLPRYLALGYYAAQSGASVILRGIRAVSDYEYELQMALMNRRLRPEIETVFLMAGEAHSFVSSRLVKEVIRLRGNISGLVPPSVEGRLRKRVLGEP